MDFRSKLPTYSGARASGLRPPGSTMGGNFPRKSTVSDNSAGPKGYGYTGQRGLAVPGSATSRTSMYPVNRPSTSAFSAQKSNLSMMSAKKGKAGLFGMTPQSTKRPSFNPGTASSAGRRSSIIGQSRHIQETRPLSDRSYHVQVFEKVFHYLQDNGFNCQLTPKFVQSPTGSDVRKIFDFLFLCLDQNLKIVHLDTDVPNILKMLGYPFQVNKSNLVSWASPQAKGHLFGMFDWLVDAVNYSRSTDIEQLLFSSFDDEINSTSEIFKLIVTTTGGEADTDELLENLALKRFGTKEEFEQLNSELEQLEQEVQAQEEEIEKIQALPETIVAYKKDMARYDEYIANMEAHIANNEETLSQLVKEYREKKEMFDATKKNRDELLIQVKDQQFGLEEVEWARDRQRLLEDEIRNEELAIEDLKKNIRIIKLELTKSEDTLNKMFHDAGSWIHSLKDILCSPSISQYVGTLQTILNKSEVNELCNYFSEDSASDKTNKKMRSLFSKIINETKMAILEQLTGLEGIVRTTEQQKLIDIDMSLKDLEESNLKIQSKTGELSSQMEEIRRQNGSDWSGLQSDYENNKHYLIELDMKVKGSQEETRDRLNRLRQEYENEMQVTKTTKVNGLREFKEHAEKQKREALKILNFVTQTESNLKTVKSGLQEELAKQEKTCIKFKRTLHEKKKR
ncbi:Kinetochore protein NDC80 -like protein [Halotydeus destructor]|nr:Kinetochore protein NDC80 -like protein [Halotydeus destructor]